VPKQVPESSRDVLAVAALHFHEVRVGGLNQSLLFVFPQFVFLTGVQQISFNELQALKDEDTINIRALRRR
jgi:hypothetical protein